MPLPLAPPAVSGLTRTVYDALPDVYRRADADQSTTTAAYPLLRFLAGLLDPAAGIPTVVDRVAAPALDELDTRTPARGYGAGTYGSGTYGAETSELVDAFAADAGWLPWLAQLLGVDGLRYDDPAAVRAALANPDTVWQRGTVAHIVAVVRSQLANPAGSVRVEPHSGGDPWTIGVYVNAADVVDGELALLTPPPLAGYQYVVLDDSGTPPLGPVVQTDHVDGRPYVTHRAAEPGWEVRLDDDTVPYVTDAAFLPESQVDFDTDGAPYLRFY